MSKVEISAQAYLGITVPSESTALGINLRFVESDSYTIVPIDTEQLISWIEILRPLVIQSSIWEHIHFHKQIGEGAFGKVFLGFTIKNYGTAAEKVAIKILALD